MGLNLRKTIVGLAVLVALLGVYVGYTRWGGDAPIEIRDVPQPSPNDVGDMSGDRTGKAGDFTFGRIGPTRLIHANATGRIDRDFGFDDLYHSQGKQWEATYPFMTMYQPGFKCSVTADKGRVQIESDADRLIPNDAAFSGNVVIHIASSEPNDVQEAFIYLDDVMFTAEKSLFSTSGPVRFASNSARLVGRGMELLYDEQRERLELFSIQKLESFLIRSEAFRPLMKASHRSSEKPPVQPVSSRAEPRPASNAASGNSQPIAYECIFSKNVRIVTPEQIIRARDSLSITNILWGGPKTEEPNRPKDTSRTATGTSGRSVEPNLSESLPDPGNEAMSTARSNAPTLDSLPDSLFDIAVTCKGGFVVRPMGTTLPARAVQNASISEDASDSQVVDDPLREIVMAQSIDVDASTGNTVLSGPVQTRFRIDPNSIRGLDRLGQKIPVTVDAQKDVRFFSDSNQVVLDGNCRVTATKADPNIPIEYVLTAPKLTLDLIEDPNASRKNANAANRAWGPAVTLRQATASGGPVALRILQKTALGLIGWVELQGSQLDYEAQQNHFTVIGPGQISLYNSQAAGGKADSNEISLLQPCYASLRNFDRLTYSEAANRIVAESKSKQLLIDYIQWINGQAGRHVMADVGHIEVELAPAAGHRMELASLTASEGIAYQEKDGVNQSQFDGSTLFYDHRKALMTIRGDKDAPCYFNGFLVNDIEMNVKTHQTKAKVIAPSTLRVR